MPVGIDNDKNARAPAKAPAKPPPRPPEGFGLRVSLMPSPEKKIRDPQIGWRNFLIITGLGLTALAAIVAAPAFRVRSAGLEIAAIKTQTQKIAAKRAAIVGSFKESKIVQSRLRVLSLLLPEHRRAGLLLVYLEEHTLPGVAYSSAAIGVSGSVSLVARAASYEDFAAQVEEIRSDGQVLNVAVSAMSPEYGEDGTFKSFNFTMTVSFDPAVFKKEMAKK